MSLPTEVEASFTTIIDSILAASDLDTISEKRIRQGLQQSVEYDITPQKTAIKALIMRRFDKFDEQRKAPPQTNGHASVKEESSASPQTFSHTSVKQGSLASQQTNGHTTVKENSPLSSEPTRKATSQSPKKHKQESDEEELSDVKNTPPPKKKKKVERDSDAAYAAKLQAQENARTRSTRGGGPKAPPPKKNKKSPKKKTSAKVKAEDDSDIDASGSDVKEKVRSDNEIKLSRPQTVKRIWAYVRAKDLQDPSDKRMIRCDDALRAVFKQDKVHMFTMNKILSQNLYVPDE
ncbi:hypothetical protein HO133_008851 [Letharia lupina]|uniref:DM2 domain-containing protein n=1 Tax=Letharia lupina TaxID=560253 RepID=A0A8H6FG86_9LECA|nr:uncharacterized protein HO133_008851 [Letharia lupina]KAF6227407.1 hypothetical protein HO133_008851 [Letharia lupina]